MTADVTTPHDGARPAASSGTAAYPTAPSATDPAWTTASVLRRLSTPSALVSLGLYVAAGGHVIAMLTHLSHGWNIAAFFLACAAVQVVAAGRVARGAGPAFLSAVLAATLGLVLLYLASRTMTLPFGGVHTVHNDRPQDADLPGTVVVAAELLTLATGPALLPATVRRWATNAMLLVGVGLWAAWGVGLL
jgi:hypothetical protein